MLIAVSGKSNTGKTTFFSAATLVEAEISNRIFTTIKPNRGVTYVRVPCPCKKAGVTCTPRNSKCVDGVRYVPVELIDIAGLVPGAHKGKGLGNQFLSDIMEANALIHIVDISGSTDHDGNPVQPGSHDPMIDIEGFIMEIDYWIFGILQKVWSQISRKAEAGHAKLDDLIHKQLTGLGITLEDVKSAMKEVPVNSKSTDEELLRFIGFLREKSKPVIIAGNKIDIPGAEDNLKRIQETSVKVRPCYADGELALRKAAEKGLIRYNPGDRKFEVLNDRVDEKQKQALDFIQKNVLDKYGSTGVQDIIDRAVFELLGMIVVYPVANIGKMTDKKGNVLPDAHLVRKGTTLKEFAERVHSTMAEHFIGGLNMKRQKIGADYVLKDGDVVEILFRK